MLLILAVTGIGLIVVPFVLAGVPVVARLTGQAGLPEGDQERALGSPSRTVRAAD